jgi:hypothetical protein
MKFYCRMDAAGSLQECFEQCQECAAASRPKLVLSAGEASAMSASERGKRIDCGMRITDEDVEAVERAVGMGHGAWDCVDPRTIISAAVALLAPVCRHYRAGQDTHFCQNCGHTLAGHVER